MQKLLFVGACFSQAIQHIRPRWGVTREDEREEFFKIIGMRWTKQSVSIRQITIPPLIKVFHVGKDQYILAEMPLKV